MQTKLAARYREQPPTTQVAAPEQGVKSGSPPAKPEINSAAKPAEPPVAPTEQTKREPEAELKHVPYDRFKEVNDKAKEAARLHEEAESRAKAAEERLAQLEQDAKDRRVSDLLDRVKSGKAEDINADEIVSLIDTVTDDKLSHLQKDLADMRAQRDVEDHLGELGMTREQRAAVVEVMRDRNLDVDDAVLLTQAKRGDLFPQHDARSFNSAQHGSQRPGRTGPPPQQSALDRVRSAGSPQERKMAAVDMIRARLARKTS